MIEEIFLFTLIFIKFQGIFTNDLAEENKDSTNYFEKFVNKYCIYF